MKDDELTADKSCYSKEVRGSCSETPQIRSKLVVSNQHQRQHRDLSSSQCGRTRIPRRLVAANEISA